LVLRFIGITVKKASYPTFLTVDELKSARILIIKKQQERQFMSEIVCLRDGKEIESKSKILGLRPFLDTNGVLRVGGRPQISNMRFDVKHPTTLDKCLLSDLIIKKPHAETLHVGINLMRNQIQRVFWIFRLRDSLQKILRECVTCARYRQCTVYN